MIPMHLWKEVATAVHEPDAFLRKTGVFLEAGILKNSRLWALSGHSDSSFIHCGRIEIPTGRQT